MLDPWASRPAEVANLLNPAFTGVLLRQAVDGYVRESAAGMPFAIAFLVLPFSLHKGTSDRLPARVTTYVQQWVQDNRDVLVTFPSRMRTLLPYTREGIIFASQRQVLLIDGDGLLQPGAKKPYGVSNYLSSSPRIAESLKQATFMGRWLALSGTPTTLYSVLGVTP